MAAFSPWNYPLALAARKIAHALAAGLADAVMDSGRLAGLWDSLGQTPYESGVAVERWCLNHVQKVPPKAQCR